MFRKQLHRQLTNNRVMKLSGMKKVNHLTPFPMILCFQGMSYSGFLWDSSSGIDLKDATVLESPAANGNGSHAHPRLYLAHFYVSSGLL